MTTELRPIGWGGGGGLTADSVDRTHLSQLFGVSGGRLANLILTPVAGEILRIGNATASSPFTGLINGAPSDVAVVYDTDANEDMFNGLIPYDGVADWGRIVLHNTTRGTSRRIEDVNRATNTITTESTIDAWADNDALTVQSQTNLSAGYFDIDLSDFIATTDIALVLYSVCYNTGAGAAISRTMRVHPYEAYNVGNMVEIAACLPDELTSSEHFMKVVSQRITVWLRNPVNHYYQLMVHGRVENADT